MINNEIKTLERHLEINNGFAKHEALKALNIINHLRAENEALTIRNTKLEATVERLENENVLLQGDASSAQAEIERLLQKLQQPQAEAIEEFTEIFLKKVHDNHYLLVDRINSKDYGMFTIGIEQAVDETKKEMVGNAEKGVTTMPNKIKPCKCGGNAHVTIGYIIGIPITYRVVCDKCFKSTQAVDTESQAIDEWNRSVDDER